MIKSQDDLNKIDQHSTDVLITALEKCEKLEKQLKIAVEVLDFISTFTIIPDENTMEQVSTVYMVSSNALNQIEELDKCLA